MGDDPAAKSSTVPGASAQLLADLRMPILYPSNSQEILDLGLHGIALSRACGLWVGMKIVTNVADGAGPVEVDGNRVLPSPPLGTLDGAAYEHRPSSHEQGVEAAIRANGTQVEAFRLVSTAA